MKIFLIALAVALVAFAPVLVYPAMLPYLAIDAIGGLLGAGDLLDRRRAFRVGLAVGGAVSVLALLHVARKDRDRHYLAAAVAVAMCLALVGLLAPSGPERDRVEGRPVDARAPERPPASVVGQVVARAWPDRAAYEQDAARLIHESARSAGRLQLQEADTRLELLQRWSDAAPSAGGGRAALRERRQQQAARRAADAVSRMAVLRPELERVMQQAHEGQAPVPVIDPDTVLASMLQDLQRGLSLAPWDPGLWTGYGMLLVDVDVEAAFGAMLVAERLWMRDGARFEASVMSEQLLELAAPASEHSRARARILRERARVQAAQERGVPREASSIMLAGRVLPPPQRPDRGGLQADALLPLRRADGIPGLDGPIRPLVDGDVPVRARADLAAAGVSQRTRNLPSAAVDRSGVVILGFDLLGDGTVTGVLVDSPSGDPVLDGLAIDAAVGWRFDPLPDGRAGTRRRIRVEFTGGSGLAGASQEPSAGDRDTAQAERLLLDALERQVRMISPRYPASAIEQGLTGTALIEVRVGGDGVIRSVRLARSSGHDVLDTAAIEAARRWRIETDGRTRPAHEVRAVVPVDFRLDWL